jgi:hypothetical protein
VFLNPGFDPNMPWSGQKVAKKYMRRLNVLGHISMVLIGSKLVSVAVTPHMALVACAVVLGIAYYYGQEYRKHAEELLRRTSFIGLVKLGGRAWQFWVAGVFLSGLAIGTVQWSEFDTWKSMISWIGAAGLILEFWQAARE